MGALLTLMHSIVGPGAGGVGPGTGMPALGFFGSLIQMPGTRGVLIPCVCACVLSHIA